MIYIVSYTLKPRRDATKVIQALQQSPYWWHFLDDTWLISTGETASQIYERIRTEFLASDRILIMQFTPNAQYAGWLPQDAWDWIEQHKYK